MESLGIVICFRKLCKDIGTLKERIAPIMQYNNFITLEDRIAIFRKKTFASASRHCSTSSLFFDNMAALKVTSSYLRTKLRSIVTKRKLRVKYLLEKINPRENYELNERIIGSVFIESIIESVIKIRTEKYQKWKSFLAIIYLANRFREVIHQTSWKLFTLDTEQINNSTKK
ncbi:hypothetical protein [Candidatus Ichthyocystis hellenicum]|uniref:hypothetical protein n=1 Tax=Candidatus Ichthyocystis hellenicum TaxID=1561003 RepID=UPI000B89FC7C|nr:hypothetical protein [Candidatus Ichthyocystis hellenicum]